MRGDQGLIEIRLPRPLHGKTGGDAGDVLEAGEYAFHLENGNRYRREDLTFYVEDTTGKLIKLR